MSLSFLRGLLGGAARTTIAGLALTAANYKVATDFLKGRFGKLVVIERAHVNKLLNVALVFNERDTTGLHRLNDKIEIHQRGLKALEVNANTYEGIVVPAILGKLPEAVKLQIMRENNYTEWKIEDLLKDLLSEFELREEHCRINKSESNHFTHSDKDKQKRTGKLNTASALLPKMNDFCGYCNGGHSHHDCTIVESVEERRQLLRKYSRCFVCACKGHISRTCNF